MYDKPAEDWNQALPVGNGRIGAMIFGGVPEERLQINEDTLWGGGPHDYNNENAARFLPELRKLIFAGEIDAAERLTTGMMGKPALLMPYQPFCDLRLHVEANGEVEDYRRTLNLDDAIALVTYRIGAVHYRREMFVSHPDQVLVLHLTADHGARQEVMLSMDSPQPDSHVETVTPKTIQLTGQMAPRHNAPSSWTGSWNEPGMRYAAWLRVRVDGGTVTQEGERLHVRDARSITVLFSNATSFKTYQDIDGDALGRVRQIVEKATKLSMQQLQRSHVADFRSLMGRVRLQLSSASATDTTDSRIRNFQSAADPALAALYYQFGRYLLISSSRPGSQPANLQGIWNQELVPPWGSKWTTNINLQMNYWPAESGDLWESETPLWDLIDDLRITGAETARVHYHARGWVLHHNTDLWRAATPVDGPWGVWPVGGIWLANQMWDHYQFSDDKGFLTEHAYPAIKGAVRFVLDTLVEAPQGNRFAHYLVTNPSFSPENQYILDGKPERLTYAATIDLELIADLFNAFEQASQLLQRDATLRGEMRKARARLPPLQVGARGQLQEWIEDYAENEPSHRHVSHLYGLYPGHVISLRGTPELAAAARRSLELRGDEGTGWAKAWKAALWARLGDGNRAHTLLQGLIGGSTLPNMFDDCPPFQIDGNFGGSAAIGEMLVQSDGVEIALLPALPSAWPSGKTEGLRARGGVKVDMEWRDAKLTAVKLVSDSTRKMRIRAGIDSVVVMLHAHAPLKLNGRLQLINSTHVAAKKRLAPNGRVSYIRWRGSIYAIMDSYLDSGIYGYAYSS
jgi:alpha-L-fucosidase 2